MKARVKAPQTSFTPSLAPQRSPAVPQHKEEPASRDAPAPLGSGHDFSQIRVHSGTRGGQAAQRVPEWCPLGLSTPRSCPFGGACHACPAMVQAKLTVNRPGDEYEEEADRVADQVMRMPEPRLQRQEEEPEEEEEEEPVQAKRAGGPAPQVGPGLAAQIRSSRGSGRRLPQDVRRPLEAKLGYDFGDVRIHAGGESARMSRDLRAQAFTVGKDVHFAAGKYDPATSGGLQLLAHELTHVVQQGGIGRLPMQSLSSAPSGCTRDRAERHHAAGESAAVVPPGPVPADHRPAIRQVSQGSASVVRLEPDEKKLPPGKYVRLPKPVVQFDEDSCWAAASEAWLDLAPGREKLTQDQLVGRFASDVGSGRLEPQCTDREKACFPKFASAVGMAHEDVFVNEVSPRYLIERLMKGPVLVMYNVSSGGRVAHAVVVYGVGRPQGRELQISFMDPADGGHYSLGVIEFHQRLAGPGATRRIRRPNWITPPTPGYPRGTFARAKVGWVGAPPSESSAEASGEK